MDEDIENLYLTAVQELRRIEHIIFVTLKYTRTVDVLKSIVSRMIEMIDYMLDLLLESYKFKGDIESYQKSPGLKVDQIRNLTEDDKISGMLDFYLLLRKASRAEYETINEYKRHVGMVMQKPDGSELIINIDTVTQYYHDLKECLDYVYHFVFDEKSD